ncbi:hypothetical protein A5M85_10495 [Cellulophaga lytica]|uniref:hypothetical protein n=1 Tax=Cellulophaga lytica TaxID=979 RepID=UPI000950AF52|nr:hypothetical protein [Cellulophaga lytica]APU10692.1 hypothetical protein A5M85_10495 [Cellulophaga lytica]
MAPLKFEEHLKDKLKDREITPSSNAWSKVAAGLESQPINKKNKKPAYFAIAACLVGLLIASVWFFNTAEPSNNSPQVVDTDKVDDSKKSILKTKTIFKEENTTVVASKEVTIKEEKNTVIKQEAKINTPENQFKRPEQTKIAAYEKTNKQLKINQPEKTIIDAKLNVVMEKLALLEENNIAVTDAEVDSLLRNAQQEILAEKAIKAGMSVDAMALLIEAESELDVSFRDKIFDNLKRRYLKLKTAVAARTN